MTILVKHHGGKHRAGPRRRHEDILQNIQHTTSCDRHAASFHKDFSRMRVFLTIIKWFLETTPWVVLNSNPSAYEPVIFSQGDSLIFHGTPPTQDGYQNREKVHLVRTDGYSLSLNCLPLVNHRQNDAFCKPFTLPQTSFCGARLTQFQTPTLFRALDNTRPSTNRLGKRCELQLTKASLRQLLLREYLYWWFCPNKSSFACLTTVLCHW
jgi:hypothetical protein